LTLPLFFNFGRDFKFCLRKGLFWILFKIGNPN